MTDSSVRRSVTVQAPIEKAFAVFTQGFDGWWPRNHKIGESDLKQAVLEGKEGGRWYEIDTDGSECDWGRVLAWEPPTRLVLAWQIDATWKFDPELVTEVEIRFVSEGPGRTRVELEHRDLDRFGEAQEQARAAFDSPGGWAGLLEAFAQAAAA
ncbi:SRPBCC family protein [Streptomyces gibsoniae]|uniref:SRPBCC family protein n=1 Tax=Streptomyces gibsoniae TaxID=3075529 RepID=A0ABU2U9J7_9ACTN|nr:SRPBCC family protein [Streptomyces sp. DSM 41699]MDT0469824.1 SRPBCC family protein [Streptomyces sp. DSM 41699]